MFVVRLVFWVLIFEDVVMQYFTTDSDYFNVFPTKLKRFPYSVGKFGPDDSVHVVAYCEDLISASRVRDALNHATRIFTEQSSAD